eukprot:scaffold22016_cov29-Prasinocladus_malaysianus.AAC.1
MISTSAPSGRFRGCYETSNAKGPIPIAIGLQTSLESISCDDNLAMSKINMMCFKHNAFLLIRRGIGEVPQEMPASRLMQTIQQAVSGVVITQPRASSELSGVALKGDPI